MNVDPNEDNERMPIILWTSCAYTIQSIGRFDSFEAIIDLTRSSLLRTTASCRFQIHLLSVIVSTKWTVAVVDESCRGLRSSKRQWWAEEALLETAFWYVLGSSTLTGIERIRSLVLLLSRTTVQNPSLADIDLFHLLVSLCFTLPILFASREASSSLTNVATGNLNDLYLMRLITMVHCIQILTSPGFIFDTGSFICDDETSDRQCAAPRSRSHILSIDGDESKDCRWSQVATLGETNQQNRQEHHVSSPTLSIRIRWCVCSFSSSSSNSQLLPIEEIREKLKHSLLPLLRCAALFYHNLTGMPWPVDTGRFYTILCERKATLSTFVLTSGLDEYSTICLYLGLPVELSDLFDTEHESGLNDLINNWIATLSTSKPSIKYPTIVNQLYPLPQEYIDLMNQVSQG